MGPDWAALLKPAVRRILDAMLGGATTLTEIANATGLSKSAVLPHLKALVALGVVEGARVPTTTGSEAVYRLRDASLHLSIRAAGPTAISWATTGPWDPELSLLSQIPQDAVREEIARFLRALEDAGDARTFIVILYGSGARGEATWKSDLDLLFLSRKRDPARERRVADAAFAAQMDSQHPFSTSFLTHDEWPTSRKEIVRDAREEGMIVWAPRGEDAPWSTMKRYGAIRL